MTNEELNFQFTNRVKQLNEFFDRFNFKDKYNIKGSTISRQINIVSLFNLEKRELISSQESKNFVNEISKDTVSNLLTINDSNWFSLVQVDFLYNNKKTPFLFILKPNIDSVSRISWEIINIKSEIFDNLVKNNKNYINPQSHEIHFIDLSKLMMKKEINKSNLYNLYKQNNISIFTFLLKNGCIEFMQTNDISYHFYQINGWFFSVDEFKRHKNSGWLISSVKDISTLNLNKLINENYY